MFPEIIHHVILYVLSNIGRDLGKTELDNILYLIDVESYKRTSELITKSTYIRKIWGPYNVELPDVIREMKWHEIKVTTTTLEKSGREKRLIKLNDYPRFEPEIDEITAEVIRDVLNEIKHLSPIQLKRECFHTPPMEAIIEQESDTRLIDEKLEFE